MRRVAIIIAAGILLICEWRLGVRQVGGPSHRDIELAGAIPATFYLPGEDTLLRAAVARRGEKKPAGVVLVHGYSADRESMSALARRIAQNGYAVIAIDLRGHGANRNPFVRSELLSDVRSAVDFIRGSSYVDGSKVAVMGHSMGAGAVLDYATRDPGLRGAVMISGGSRLEGPDNPRNALFIFASGDPERIKSAATELAGHFAGVQQVELGRVYGSIEHGTAVRVVEVSGADHVSIIFSQPAAETMIRWLDSVFNTNRNGPVLLGEPRLRLASLGYAAFFVVLIGVGELVGRIAPKREAIATAGGWSGLAGMAGALIVAMPFVASASPASFIPIDLGDRIVSWLAVSGALMLAVMASRGAKWREPALSQGATYVAAAAEFVVIYVLLAPFGVVFHRLTPTAARLGVLAASAVTLFPFFLAFETVLRRGGMLISSVVGVLGRVLILVVLAIGVRAHILPPVVLLMLPTLAIQFAMFEVFAAAAYAEGACLTTIASVEAAWLGWILAVFLPITV